MLMFESKKLILIIICLSIFLCISSVSASDGANTTDIGTFDDLNHDIQSLEPGTTYNIEKDYYFNSSGKNVIIDSNVITIDMENITINGNGHVIDAGGAFYAIFKVTGNNVKIFNLTIINSRPNGPDIPSISILDNPNYQKTYHDVSSPISRYGDNGVISDCTLINNEAINGGAICWMGKNGTLNNCKFINNTARGIGGAIYIGGENNTLINCVFINNLGQLSHEAVYLDRNRKNINFTNCVFESGDKYIIDGSISNIDVKYLKYNIDSYFSDVKFNLVYILYSAMMNAGMNYIGNDISYCAIYNDKTKDITLSIVRYFDEYGVSYGKDYIFKNIDDLNEVFTLMYGGSFVNDITIVVDRYVNSEADYNAARTTEIYTILNSMGDIFDSDFEGYLPLNNLNTILKVNFEKQLNFKSTNPWVPQCIGFNTVILNGHGSTIEGTYDTDDEYQWAIISKGCSFIASNFTIKGYNSTIVNDGGYCAVSDTIFDSNKMDYLIHEDYGGAVRNKGICIFNNCSFINNYAKYGGAIYNEGVLILNQCTFRDNEGYNKGNNVFLCEGAQVTVDGKNITETTDIVYVYESTVVDAICVIASSVVFVVASILICYAAVEIFVLITPFASVAGVIAVAGVSLVLTAGLIFVAYQSLTGTSEGNDDMNTVETFNFSPV